MKKAIFLFITLYFGFLLSVKKSDNIQNIIIEISDNIEYELTEPIKEGNDLKILAAIALAESAPIYNKQQYDIYWIYYNRYIKKGKKAFNASSAYKYKHFMFKLWLTVLGDNTYSNDLVPNTSLTIKEYINSDPYIKTQIKHAKAFYNELPKMKHNPFKGWIGQGSLNDLNLDYGKWKLARRYLQLQKQNLVQEKLVAELPADKKIFYSYIFNEEKIYEFFSQNPHLITNNIYKYQP